MARRKNTKFIDPRYFMDEKTEVLNEGVDPGDQPAGGADSIAQKKAKCKGKWMEHGMEGFDGSRGWHGYCDEKKLDEGRADAYTKFTDNVWFIDGERANLMVPKNMQKLITAQKPFQVFLQHASGQNAQLEGGDFVQVTPEILKKAGMDTSMGVNMRALGKVLVALVNPRVPKDERGTVKQVRHTQRR